MPPELGDDRSRNMADLTDMFTIHACVFRTMELAPDKDMGRKWSLGWCSSDMANVVLAFSE